MTLKQINYSFYIFLFVYFLILAFSSTSLSLSIKEITIFYDNEHSLLWYLTHISTHFFGTTNFGIRIPFVLFYVLSVLIAYWLSEDYFTKPIDRLISIIIFMLLPGLNSAALLVDTAIVVIFCTLLYLYLFKLYGKEYYVLLVLFLFIDNSFAILFLALFFYSLQKKDNVLLIISLVLFGLSMQIYGFDLGGHPKSYFLQTFASYASIFSPIIFLYFFYTLYRISIKGQKDLYWYISFTSLILSLVFSLRQRVDIADFAPYLVIAVPLMVKTFLHSYRVRLKEFRYKHKVFANIMLLTLLINTTILLFNKPIYLFLNDPKDHFAYRFHIVNDLAKQLKLLGIKKVYCEDRKLQKKLDYYGVTNSNVNILLDTKVPTYHKKIEIKYGNKIIKTYYLLLQK